MFFLSSKNKRKMKTILFVGLAMLALLIYKARMKHNPKMNTRYTNEKKTSVIQTQFSHSQNHKRRFKVILINFDKIGLEKMQPLNTKTKMTQFSSKLSCNQIISKIENVRTPPKQLIQINEIKYRGIQNSELLPHTLRGALDSPLLLNAVNNNILKQTFSTLKIKNSILKTSEPQKHSIILLNLNQRIRFKASITIGNQNSKLINPQEVSSPRSIDINSYLNRFDTIPDSISKCTVSIMVDLPSDDNYRQFFHAGKGPIGHVFISLAKACPNVTIIQYIGFYPQNPLRGLVSNVPVPPKFEDNQYHGYNASLTMKVRPESFRVAIQNIRELASYAKYSINNYNCTDFSLQVINAVRGVKPLIIPKLDTSPPSNLNTWNTPEGLYQLLENMKHTDISESNCIIISNSKIYAGPSSGGS